jgi:hypothetical protein
MNQFGVLTNRKRALIALIHSIFFLGIAIHGFSAPKGGILHSGPGGDFALVIIYLVVASILVWLVGISRVGIERAYFTLCACSASFGLLRTVFGDSSLPAAQYMRVILLSFAIAVGGFIVRTFSRPIGEPAVSE